VWTRCSKGCANIKARRDALEVARGLHFTTFESFQVSICRVSGGTTLAKSAGEGLARAMLYSRVNAMKDLLFILITVGFFAGAWLYTKACEKL